MRFCILASGSRGNATWIEEGGEAILIDCGLSAKELRRRAAIAKLDLNTVRALVISHEHSDHITGAGPVARILNLPIYATVKTAEVVKEKLGKVSLETFDAGDELDFGFLHLQTITISHDAADPVAFVAKGRQTLGIVTDLGVVTHLVRENLKNLSGLILEFNHDYQALMDGPYPYYLKQRVRSRYGHLSNEQAAELLAEIRHKDLKTVILGHLSENNNTPELALTSAKEALGQMSITLFAASQDNPTEIFDLSFV